MNFVFATVQNLLDYIHRALIGMNGPAFFEQFRCCYLAFVAEENQLLAKFRLFAPEDAHFPSSHHLLYYLAHTGFMHQMQGLSRVHWCQQPQK
jgi:hypothetical protein